MNRKLKHRITALIDTVIEMIDSNTFLNNIQLCINDCIAALYAISEQLTEETKKPEETIAILEDIKIHLRSLESKNSAEEQKIICTKLNDFKQSLKKEVTEQYKAVFMPYKASMWDSLETIYENAIADENCDVKVVPIPYYQLTQNEAVYSYEGNRYPKSIAITHYSEYRLHEEEPDVIYIHNIYDDFNTLTRVHEEYFTSNLKQYTDMLVYVPYYTASFIPYIKGKGFYPYNYPSIKNIDKMILVNEKEREIAVKEGVPSEKLEVLGSPKLDKMVKALQEPALKSHEWEEKIKDKTVYLINTGCLFFANDPFLALERLIDLFNIPRFFDDNVVIWRPHPLTQTSIQRLTPAFLEYYEGLIGKLMKEGNKFYPGVILDQADDYLPALKAADILVTTDSSILRSYLLTEKKVIYWDKELPKEALIPSNAFYFAFDEEKPWFEIVKEINSGNDNLAENRVGLANMVYVNTDGTAGQKIYCKIKASLINTSSH